MRFSQLLDDIVLFLAISDVPGTNQVLVVSPVGFAHLPESAGSRVRSHAELDKE
jgi:hypothetical protein